MSRLGGAALLFAEAASARELKGYAGKSIELGDVRGLVSVIDRTRQHGADVTLANGRRAD
ncbi:hypothetical protein CCR94_09245 [Rhodoblastus sphagnicola]|uniref:Uncharacterized protein n=1 Tax=Rhodoblastus sphagnicola TaxID=333368 RepID=A0A2S6NA29_9HYPH|nr:hypothetical protein [Rhodoblastus sphagnicola]MBB4198852.1 hypothetical protein [Rhodoblastus sphagnicola]PPQ31473.1 hypothetical protein CCR94_09245 [Rhodoblastus sphagnicola]